MIAAVKCFLQEILVDKPLKKFVTSEKICTFVTPTVTETRFLSPTETRFLSPTETRFLSPTETRFLSPTETRFLSPTETRSLSPTETPRFHFYLFNAVVAQLVEHQLPKLRVASSSLVYRSLWRDVPDIAPFSYPCPPFLGCHPSYRLHSLLLLFHHIIWPRFMLSAELGR